MSGPYKPIACSLYDWLEASVVKKRAVEIRFNGATKTIQIKDLQTRDQAEYLIGVDMETGNTLTVRLDQVEAYLDAVTKEPLATSECS